MNADDEYGPTAEFNFPSLAAPQGAGYNVVAVSGGCTEIPFIDSPEDWSPDLDPPAELRGFVRLCTGCL